MATNAPKTFADTTVETTTIQKDSNEYVGIAQNDVSKKIKTSNLMTKDNVGLGNVDNTSDINKPISTAVQNALNTKETIANVDALKGAGWVDETVKGNATNIATLDTNKQDKAITIDEQATTVEEAINSLESSKVNTSDIVDDLTTGGVTKVLSAEQGKVLGARLNTAEDDIAQLELDLADAELGIANNESAIVNLQAQEVINTSGLNFESGMISWEGNADYERAPRIRSNYIWLQAGSKISLTDYSNYQIAWYKYSYKALYYFESWSGSWITSEFTIPVSGYYRFAIGTIDSSDITDIDSVSALINLTSIKSPCVPRYKGARAGFLGDSITYGYYYPDWNVVDNPFPSLLKKYLNLSESINYGIPSTAISTQADYADSSGAFVNRYSLMDDNLDLIVVFGGTNDFGHNTPLGTVSDKTDISFYGALDVLINGLINKYQDKKIVFFTPMHRNRYGTEGETNTIGVTLKEYVQAIKDVCELYGIPVLDLYAKSGLSPYVTSIYNNYINDGLHPNIEGHKILAENIYKNLEIL